MEKPSHSPKPTDKVLSELRSIAAEYRGDLSLEYCVAGIKPPPIDAREFLTKLWDKVFCDLLVYKLNTQCGGDVESLRSIVKYDGEFSKELYSVKALRAIKETMVAVNDGTILSSDQQNWLDFALREVFSFTGTSSDVAVRLAAYINTCGITMSKQAPDPTSLSVTALAPQQPSRP